MTIHSDGIAVKPGGMIIKRQATKKLKQWNIEMPAYSRSVNQGQFFTCYRSMR
jgi:hypothetical protein